ncbi:hypothetical protein N0M98_09380 [Paenibacillus doosanensis]|uniref:hypothetical protein n=1 Tax=Paenibacillus doosanensis TaxID=1229154 RepID=UPI00217FA8D4|nr:hypothetical protein [Paenibacillus doosanensis]MCS7460352.1 hypothetical protein [Paenibacillus doosanensis]
MYNISIASHGKFTEAKTNTRGFFIEVNYFCDECDCQHFFYIKKYRGYPIEPGSCGAIINGHYSVANVDESWIYYKILADLIEDDSVRLAIDVLAIYYNVI